MLRSQTQNGAFLHPGRKTRVAFSQPRADEALSKINRAGDQPVSSAVPVAGQPCLSEMGLAAKNDACPRSCVFSRHSLTGNPKINHFGFGFCFFALRFFSSPRLHPPRPRPGTHVAAWDENFSGWQGSTRTQKHVKTVIGLHGPS